METRDWPRVGPSGDGEYVPIERLRKAERERDEWKARAEKAEAKSRYAEARFNACRGLEIEKLRERAEKYCRIIDTMRLEFADLEAMRAEARQRIKELEAELAKAEARIAELEREIADHAEWARAFAADPANGAMVKLLRERDEYSRALRAANHRLGVVQDKRAHYREEIRTLTRLRDKWKARAKSEYEARRNAIAWDVAKAHHSYAERSRKTAQRAGLADRIRDAQQEAPNWAVALALPVVIAVAALRFLFFDVGRNDLR